MKKILIIIIFIGVSISMHAQSDGISYQAVIIDPNVHEMPGADVEGSILANTVITVRFTILDSFDNVVYQELQTTSTDQYGMINLLIGVIDPIGFSQIEWNGRRKDLKVEIDFNNSGESYVGLSRQPLLFIPYAYHRNITASGSLSVDGQSSLYGPLRVNDGQPSVFTGDISVMGIADISGLAVSGAMNVNSVLTVMDTTSSTSKDTAALIVEGGVGIEKDLVVGNNSSIDGNLGVGTKANNFKLSVEGEDSGHIMLLENKNDDDGGGLVIKLGKNNAKNEDWQNVEVILKEYYEGGVEQDEINFVTNFLRTGNVDLSYPLTWAEEYLNENVTDMAFVTCKLSESIAQSIADVLNSQLNLPREYTIDLPKPADDIKFEVIPEIIIKPLSLLCNLGAFDFGLGDIPGLVIADLNYDAVLNNTNEYISFTDKDDLKLGTIKAQSLTDWATLHLNNMYVFDLMTRFVGIDVPEAVMEVQAAVKDLAFSYLNIGVEYSSGNGDYAEWLERIDPDESITKGDIVAIKGGKITKNMEGAEQVMAVSHFPIVLGNIPPEGKEHLGNNIAFMGQVPVKIMGAIQAGDYIVAKGDIKGYGISVKPENLSIDDVKLIVGRSWETNLAKGPKMVNTVVGVHNGDYINIMKKFEQRFIDSENKFKSIEERLDLLESKTSGK